MSSYTATQFPPAPASWPVRRVALIGADEFGFTVLGVPRSEPARADGAGATGPRAGRRGPVRRRGRRPARGRRRGHAAAHLGE